MNALSEIRLLGWAVIALLLTALVLALAPQQVPVTLYKLNLVALAGVLGYWLDRSLFPYARPDQISVQHPMVVAASMIRRALIVAATMLALGLGA
jgi:type IV secretory pathway protease TraF